MCVDLARVHTRSSTHMYVHTLVESRSTIVDLVDDLRDSRLNVELFVLPICSGSK